MGKEGGKGMTNKERIQQMGYWELAEFLRNVSDNETKITLCEEDCQKCEYSEDYCTYSIAEWLGNPAPDYVTKA